jgi:hypothetical protein
MVSNIRKNLIGDSLRLSSSSMNVFQLNYEARLKSWYDLRASLENASVDTKCIRIDAWWQQAPLVNHYLHPNDVSNWPGPWDLLVDNIFCTLARGLGMYYTLLLTGVSDLDISLVKDDNDDEAALVLVDNAKYMLNWYPDTVISNTLAQFKVTSTLDTQELTKKVK